MTQQRISDSEDSNRNYSKAGTEKKTKKERKTNKQTNKEGAISVLWDNIKQINIHMKGVPEGRRSEKILLRNNGQNFSKFD